MEKSTINRILQIKESIELPYKINKILFEKDRDRIFDEFIKEEQDLSYDWFNEYFQQEQADRRELKQDYTPNCICNIIQNIAGSSEWIADLCAGSGSLVVSVWSKNKDSIFQCEEVSDRVFPILLFNMAIRNMEGYAVQKDILEGETKRIFEIIPTRKYSIVKQIQSVPENKFDTVVMNPPYSMKCKKAQHEYEEYEPLPTDKADWIFVLYGINKLKNSGKLLAILPHGVLFRGGKEMQIRKKIIKKRLLKTIIGMPDKLFYNTQIPTIILELQRESEPFIIDASKYYEKRGRINEITSEKIKEILDIYRIRKTIDKESKIVNFKEMQNNDFNLNIPRYIDKYEKEERIPIDIIMNELAEIEIQIKESEEKMLDMMMQLTGIDGDTDNELHKAIQLYRKTIGG